jgi:hypothetical protein
VVIRNNIPGSGDAFDPIAQFQNAMRSGPPWDSIVEFAVSDKYCGMKLYPRQLTLLKLIYLETEQFTQYDYDTIGEWSKGFKDRTNPMGVQPDIMDRVVYLKENGYHHFPHVQMVMGRRASKGIIGGIIGAERLAYFYSLDNWQQHFGIVDNAVGELTVVATTQGQAAKRQFADIRRTVEACAYLQPHVVGSKYTEFFIRTPSDIRHIEEMEASGTPMEREFASLYAVASAAVSTGQRGGSGFMNAYDEFAHVITGTGSTKTDTELYNAFQPSLDQFGIQKMTYIPSSPYSKIGHFFKLYQEGCVTLDEYNAREGRFQRQSFLESAASMDMDQIEEELDIQVADPEMLVVQLPSWETYRNWDTSHTIPIRPNRTRCFPRWKKPVQWSPDGDRAENKSMARMKLKNPEKFKVERGAQFASVEDAYLNEVMVDKMFEKPWWRDPLTAKDRGKFSLVYRAHADPSRSNANFGFAVGHMEDAPCTGCGWDPNELPIGTPPQFRYTHKCPAKDAHGNPTPGMVLPHVIIDKLHVWKPEDYPDHTLNYITTVGPEMAGFLRKFPSIREMSYDHYAAGFGLIDQQKIDFPAMMITTKQFTRAENDKRFERFKAAVNMQLVHSFKDDFFDDGMCLLENELKFLQEKNGKVDRQVIGPVQTKDLADCVMQVTVDLLEEHLERWYKGRTRASFGSTNAAGLKSGSEQQRMELAGVGGRQGGQPMDAKAMRGALNRQRLNDFNAGRSERGFDGRVPRQARVPRNERFGTRGSGGIDRSRGGR